MAEENIYGGAPLYIQISEAIKKKIDAGYYVVNQLLPSEAEIQKQYGVSRITARSAYKHLLELGLVRTIRGKGTYVNDIKEQDWTWMKHFTVEVKNCGRVPSSVILVFKEIAANEEIAEKLQIKKDSSVYYIKRLRYIDNFPVWLTKSYFSTKLAPNLTKEYFSVKGVSQSVFFVLERDFGIEFSTGIEDEYIGEVSEDDLDILEIDTNKPYFTRSFISKSPSGEPLVYEKTIFEQKITKNLQLK